VALTWVHCGPAGVYIAGMTADPLPSWADTGPKRSIIEFVAAVTTSSSPEFVAEIDRIAVFDNDGTLSTERPLYTQMAFALDRAAELGKPTTLEELQAAGLGGAVELIKLTHGSITTEEFSNVCRAWMRSAKHPRFDRSYASTVYQPMIELIRLLESNGFTCWIFSGGGVDFMRTWAVDVFGLPPHRVFGSLGATEFRIGANGPELLKGVDVQLLDDGPQKPISIHQHVGQRPILAAGNTNGDLPMLQWTAGNPHRTLQLVVNHTDAEREYAYDTDPMLGAGTDQLLAAASEGRWSVIDMTSDWATIYPPDA
jgi:haloacid dehalogenase-like hydrolase